MVYQYPPFNALTRQAKAFRLAADIAKTFGSMIWMLILATGLVLAALGMYEIGSENGAADAWVKGCGVFEAERACADTRGVVTLRDLIGLDLPPKEQTEAKRKARIAELCKGLPDKLAAYARCPGRD